MVRSRPCSGACGVTRTHVTPLLDTRRVICSGRQDYGMEYKATTAWISGEASIQRRSVTGAWTSRVSRLPRTGRMRFPDEDVNEALLLHVRDD